MARQHVCDGASCSCSAAGASSQSATPSSSQAAAAVPAVDATGAPGQPSIPPEEVVARSGLDANTVTGFVFENYVDYVDEVAIDDAASAAANFSDAMHMIKRHGEATGGESCRT